ncbi:MAG: hypothetical protein HYU26_14890 [Candidatus Rokubacteria bacterium]|nr:hypothetical protein [Candidatus Rokubacteria bacterium]
MSTTAGRRAGVLACLALLAAGLLLAVAPGDPGALRLGGVGLLWWYGLLAGPLAAIVLGLACGARATLAAAAAWTSPALLGLVVARVFAGAAEAPLLVLAAVTAPLLAWLSAGTPAAPGGPPARAAEAAGGALVLWASLLVLADAGEAVEIPRWLTLALAVAAAGAVGVARRTAAARVLAALGLLAFLLPVVAAGGALRLPPWAAWRDVASRPALAFAEGSAWAGAGRALARPATLAFTEAHRVTALSPGAWRVDDGTRSHEWRLEAGDSLELRPGDRLTLEAGAAVRFERGKRVPGAPVSGIAWADPPGRASAGSALELSGLVLTLAGGALALVGAPVAAPRAVVGPALLAALVLGAACLAVYGVGAAPELPLGAPPLAYALGLPALVVEAPWGGLLAAALGLALVLLFAAAAGGLRARLGGGRPPLLWLGVLVAAGAASVVPVDAWRVLLLGLGVAASAVAAPALAGASRRAALVGSAAGLVAFAALAAGELPPWAGALGRYPALVAAPLAWALARVGRVAAARRG